MSFSPPSLYRLFRANPSKLTKVALLRQFVTYDPNSDLSQEGGKKTGGRGWGVVSQKEERKNITAVALGEALPSGLRRWRQRYGLTYARIRLMVQHLQLL